MPARLLVVERHFPFSGGARTESYVQLWPGLGWQVGVLTRDPPSTPFDPEQVMADVPDSVAVERVPARPPGEGPGLLPAKIRRGVFRLVHRPLPDIEWVGPATRTIRGWTGGRLPALLYSSSPSESAHEIARRLSEEWRVPWVMDVRDLFTQYEGRFHALTPLHTAWARHLEARWYRRCNRLIVNTEFHLQKLRERFVVSDHKTLIIPNGYRDDDRCHAGESLPAGPVGPGRPLHIGYLGVLSKPANAWRAVLEGMARISSPARPIVLEIWGRPEPVVVEAAGALGLQAGVRFRTPKPHVAAMKELAASDCLLVATAPSYGHLVPQKLYNYLALERWVLAVAPVDSMVARVVETVGVGERADPEAAAVARLMERAVARVDAGELRPPVNRTALETYSRTGHARRLSEMFHEVLGDA